MLPPHGVQVWVDLFRCLLSQLLGDGQGLTGPMGFQNPVDLFLWEAGQRVEKEESGFESPPLLTSCVNSGDPDPLCPMAPWETCGC